MALADARADDATRLNYNPRLQVEGRKHLKRTHFLPWPEYMNMYGLGTEGVNGTRQRKSTSVPQWRLMLGSKPIKRLWATGGVKSVQPPTPKEATPLGETPRCGKPAKLISTTPFSKETGGTRVMTGSNGNNLSRYMDNPQGYCLRASREHMAGLQRLNGCRSAVMDHQSGAGLRYSPPTRESVWIQ